MIVLLCRNGLFPADVLVGKRWLGVSAALVPADTYTHYPQIALTGKASGHGLLPRAVLGLDKPGQTCYPADVCRLAVLYGSPVLAKWQ